MIVVLRFSIRMFCSALGFPTEFFPVLFAIPRMAGYLAHWKESLDDPDTKIARPQEVTHTHLARLMGGGMKGSGLQSNHGWSMLHSSLVILGFCLGLIVMCSEWCGYLCCTSYCMGRTFSLHTSSHSTNATFLLSILQCYTGVWYRNYVPISQRSNPAPDADKLGQIAVSNATKRRMAAVAASWEGAEMSP